MREHIHRLNPFQTEAAVEQHLAVLRQRGGIARYIHEPGRLCRDYGVEQRTLADLWGFCRVCYYAETCMAGCTAMSEPLLGRPGNNPYCHHRALEMDRVGMRERVEMVAAAGPESFAHGLFRLIREPKNGVGEVVVDEPRIGREVEFFGAGRPIELPRESEPADDE